MATQSQAIFERSKWQARTARKVSSVGPAGLDALRLLYETFASKLLAVSVAITRDRPASEAILEKIFVDVARNPYELPFASDKQLNWLCALTRSRSIEWNGLKNRSPFSGQMHSSSIVEVLPLLDKQVGRQKYWGDEGNSKAHLKSIYLRGLNYTEAAAATGVTVVFVRHKVRDFVRGRDPAETCEAGVGGPPLFRDSLSKGSDPLR